MRIFAGPNGSGKSTLYQNIKEYFSTTIFINADLLERAFKECNFIDFQEFGITVDDDAFQSFCEAHGQFLKGGFTTESWNLVVKENLLVADTSARKNFNSLHFAITADFLRYCLLSHKRSFSFETVFSHPSKLELIDLAHQNGYKVYLYFYKHRFP